MSKVAPASLEESSYRDPRLKTVQPFKSSLPPSRKGASNKSYTIEESWDALHRVVDKYDDDTVKDWKEDIDTLLVFAGLFSAVVTAFLIESYKWLQEDTGEATVSLLKQVSQQLRDPQFAPAEPEAFRPSTSSIRINCLWFLSLILALVSGLLGILCKQWLREHRRDAATRTSAGALALRQLRRDSLERWHVQEFIATTPILLELALLIFFVGLLDLAWTRHFALFVVCMIAIGLGAGMYIITTFLPLIATIYTDMTQSDDDVMSSFRFICPYKSPQAWAVYRFTCMLLRQLPFVGSLLVKRGYSWWTAVTPPRDWSSSDMRVLTSYHRNPFDLKVYELRALDWATLMLQERPSIVLHFQNILQSLSLHPSVIMTGVLNYWALAMWEDLTLSDVQEELRDMTKFQRTKQQGLGWYTLFSRAPSIPDPILHSPVGMKMMMFHNYWHSLVEQINITTVHDLNRSISQFQVEGLPKAINLRFFCSISYCC
uniref:DUF6535 domain-containing protein n=1 Tax=Moniliophthora roreri TaxID=221103 RepID=A0A0W0FIF7_MONRR